MNSPIARPWVNRAEMVSEDDDGDNGPPLFQWAYSIKPLYRALLVVILTTVFSTLLFSSFPLWRPFGVLMMYKLWDILMFVVLTTSIGLGIVNFNLCRGNDQARDAIANASSGGKEESVSSKVPFVSLFYTELQPSYNFSDKEVEVSEYGRGIRRSESGSGEGDAGATMSASTAEDDDRVKHANNDKLANIDKLANDIISRTVHSSKASVACDVQSDTKHDEVDGRHVQEPSMSVPSVNNTMKVAPTKGKSRFVKANTDDMGLGTVDHGNELVRKTRHRRGNSLEFPIIQEERARHRLRDIGPAARDQRPGDVLQNTTGDRPSSSTRKVPSLILKSTSDHTKGQSDAASSSKSNMQSVAASSSTSTSKHSRSRSAYDLNDLLVYERRPAARSKPVTTSQLARSRNVSLSCDLDKDYSTVGGVPAWLASVPAPPVPPPFDGYCGGGHREILSGERVTEKQQDESSLRKAYTESLAPWRVATNAVPVNIRRKEATGSNQRHPTREEKKEAPSKDQSTKMLSPPSSPSTPNSLMGSPGELKKKVDDFIIRFHERMRLQRLESLERSRQAGAH